MGNNHFFKSLLNRIESPPPGEDQWKIIEQKLNRREKKRRFLFIPVFIVLLLAGGAILWNMITNSTDDKVTVNQNPALTKTIESEKAKPADRKKLSSTDTMSIARQPASLVETLQKPLQAATQATETNNKSSAFNHTDNKNTTVFTSDIKSPDDNNTATIPPIGLPDKTTAADTMVLSIVNELNTDQLPHYPMVLLPSVDSGKIEPLKIGAVPFVFANNVKKPAFVPNAGLYFDLSLGFHKISSVLTNLNNNNAYITKRQNEEQSVNTLSPRFQIGYLNKKGYSAAIGLEYFQYGESINYVPYSLQKEYFKQITYKYDSVRIFNFITRSSYWKPDTTKFITQDSASRVLYNAKLAQHKGVNIINYFEIPLTVGFRKSVRKYSFGVNANISIGILNFKQTKGYYLNENGQSLVNIQTEKNNVSRVLFNYAVRLRIGRNINKNLSAFVEPGYKYNINPVYRNVSVKQRYQSLGCYFGLCYFLN